MQWNLHLSPFNRQRYLDRAREIPEEIQPRNKTRPYIVHACPTFSLRGGISSLAVLYPCTLANSRETNRTAASYVAFVVIFGILDAEITDIFRITFIRCFIRKR